VVSRIGDVLFTIFLIALILIVSDFGCGYAFERGYTHVPYHGPPVEINTTPHAWVVLGVVPFALVVAVIRAVSRRRRR